MIYKSRKYAVFKGERPQKLLHFCTTEKISLINVIGSSRTGRNTKPDREQRPGFYIAMQADIERVAAK